jgi:hypothetical protein
MKKIVLLPLLVLMTFINYSQNQELLDNSWFVNSAKDITTNNFFDNIMNTEPELRFETTFLSDRIVIQGCCGGVFEVFVNYLGTNELEIISLTEMETISCNSTFVSNFYDTIKGAFNSLLGDTITYQTNSSEQILYIDINYQSNSSFVTLANIPLENIDYSTSLYWGQEPPDHLWSLTEVHYQGESFELPYGAALTDADIYEGTFTISLCGEILVAINASWYWDIKWPYGPCFISCGIFENTTGVCEPVDGYDESYLEDFKQSVFNFLNDNINQTMEYEYTFGPARKLVIEDFSQNKLVFYSNDSYMSTTDFNLIKINIYPNPVSEILYIESGNHEIAKMSLYDINGKLLQTVDTPIQELDVRSLSNGLYFLVLENTSGEIVIRKFLKR